MEDLFRTQMESFKVDPSPGLWQKVHSKILLKQFFSFSLQTFNVYYLAAAISLAGIGTIALLSQPEPGIQEETTQSSAEAITGVPFETAPEQTVPIQKESTTSSEEITGSRTSVPETKAGRESHPVDRESAETPSENQEAGLDAEKAGQPESDEKIKVESEKKSEMVTVKVGFNASQLSGCSPLALNFENLSENAIKHSWSFSDGGSSTDKNPSYIFDEPGSYPVLLKITGVDGLEYTAQQTIEVYESPKALFELDEAVDLSSNQPIYFYNYSRGAEFYKWDFGDMNTSSLAEPIHYYENPGNYNVKLKVWTMNQCYDSLLIQNAFGSTESEVRFPNAFTPNMSGPTGGYYEINDITNTIFHPVVSGDLIEYQLKIFNRQGLQIFESNDVSTGWDGYYQEKLAAQAVYIWKARGKFSNGKTFVKSGDVTLIRQH
ncbi:PKD domain-containing protein [Bacteroidota bacterium]